MYNSSISVADIDNDNDVLISGGGVINGSTSIYKSNLYINNGAGDYVEDTTTSFVGIRLGESALVDIDNDTDIDVLITGENNSSSGITKLYVNNLFMPTNVQNLDLMDLDITLFPNPANSVINIITTETVESMQLFNQLGQEIFRLPSTTTTLSVKDLTNGVYILEINTSKGVTRKQFIKQ